MKSLNQSKWLRSQIGVLAWKKGFSSAQAPRAFPRFFGVPQRFFVYFHIRGSITMKNEIQSRYIGYNCKSKEKFQVRAVPLNVQQLERNNWCTV